MRPGRLDERGALHVPLALMLWVCCTMAAGTLALLLHWHELARTQIHLDRCVGGKARALKRLQQTIEASNLVVRANRAAIAAAYAQPYALPPLEAALAAEVAAQDALLFAWDASRVTWAARLGCARAAAAFPPPRLPGHGWTRLPPDQLGAQELTLQDRRIVIRLRHGSRAAAAEVNKDETNQSWQARYVSYGLVGAGLD